ncbi:acyl-phosphate glycerol 3-phosphate acyltransferase [Malikia spinosa]|uniref:Acyl-phosphate glycerol 3-phosphate acyltransferase n=1 Tax=Malikia spinosa TaxID=86180 RepID=A0A2S9KFE5_9BURK|nr:AMP-binding protein [Malikia spinosa]PRD69168.1 acyl-phosphate glycerol 3-phosphate acyltransferase [Malikia spinosa]
MIDAAMKPDTERLLELIAGLCRELRPGQPVPALTLNSELERDAELDSLARAELLVRIEAAFGVRLPQRLIGEAQTPRDFLRALATADSQALPVPESAPMLATGVTGTGEPAPDLLATLTEVLAWHAQKQPERLHLILLDEDGAEQRLGYGELLQRSRAVAAGLQARDIVPGDAVALMLPTGLAFFPCFLGILLAGAVPVPIYPPARPSQLEDHLRRHAAILDNAGARLLIASGEVALPAGLLRGLVAGLRGVVLADDLLACSASPTEEPAAGKDLALLQYTSGSTGNPKGVTLTHAQLLANIRAMARAAQVGPDDVFVSWLPLYHDMGLICAWLSCLVYAIPFVVMSPLRFLAAPQRWLQAIHDYRGTLSGAPNFAYELCLRRVPEELLSKLDLSGWRIAFNGAEPVNPGTMERFAARFAACGLDGQALAPVYGLAECAVGLAFTPQRGLQVDRIERAAFSTLGQAIPAAPDDPNPLRFVACGQPLPGYELRVVDASGAELPERREGRLQFRGPSATAGYWRNPQANAQLFCDGWLDTGDYAYLAGGELYLTGRSKDIVIKAGRNIYPQEVEEAVGRIAGVRPGCVAVFGSPDPASGTERLVVAAETRLTEAAALAALRQAIQDQVVELLGLPADEIWLSAQRIVLKTSSGKVRRAASRALFEQGLSEAKPRAAWLQLARVFLAGALPRFRRLVTLVSERLAGAWAVTAFSLLALPVWLGVALTRQPASAWRLLHHAARLWLALAGIKHEIVDQSGPATANARLLVANHASYLDGLVLIAALPAPGWRFVAKRELIRNFWSRVLLQKLGCEFVERFDLQQGLADAERLSEAAQHGHRLAVFPEGTFTRAPGLRPFHMGAFVTAARAGLALQPVALAGTRDRLRDGHWLPRRGTVRVTLGPVLDPGPLPGSEWERALVLRDAARATILAGCGEPDLQR